MTSNVTDQPALSASCDHAVPDHAVLAVRDLQVSYRGRPGVLQRVSVDLMPGRVTALIGPNGSGKSTLLKMLVGLTEAHVDQGEITWSDGTQSTPLCDLPAQKRAGRIAYVPQRGGVSFAFTAEQVVAMGERAGRVGRGEAMRADVIQQAMRDAACLDDAGGDGAREDAPSLAHRVFTTLSVGQQQRVLLARALAQLPGDTASRGALLLDEPTSAMDPRHAHETLRLLRTRAAAGQAVLVVLHDLALAAAYADEVWLLDGGRLALHGPAREVMADAKLAAIYGIEVEHAADGGLRVVGPRVVGPVRDGHAETCVRDS